jgi:hypothetical protein
MQKFFDGAYIVVKKQGFDPYQILLENHSGRSAMLLVLARKNDVDYALVVKIFGNKSEIVEIFPTY